MTDNNASADDHSQPREIPPAGDASSNPEVPSAKHAHRSTLRISISWFFIVLTLTFSLIPLSRENKNNATSITRDVRLELMGRYIVGIKYLLGNHSALNSSLKSMEPTLQKSENVENPILSIPILAELSGKEAALLELQRIAANPASDRIHRDILSFQQLYRYGASSLDSQQRLDINRYGWLGRLALSQDKLAADPARKAILQSALRTVVVMVILSIGTMTALLAGLIMLTIAIVLKAKGRIRSHLKMPEDPGTSLLEAFTIYLTGFIALPVFFLWLFPGHRFAAASLAILAVIAALLWPRFRGSKAGNYRQAIGWYRGQGIFREIGSGILGYIAGLPLLMVAAFFVWIISRYTSGGMPAHPILYEINKGPLYLLLWTVLACVWAPIVEEVFFRGILFGYFRRHLQWIAGGIFSALIFAIIHPQGWIGVPLITAVGFTLSTIREWRGSIIASISAHALNNGSALILLLALM